MEKRLLLIGIFLVAALNAQMNIAVIDFEGKNVSKADASALTDRLRAELFLTGKFVVLEREKMDAILKEQGFQLSGCTDDACIVQMGELIGVEQIVAGSISRVGNVHSVIARIISVEKGQIVKIAKFDNEGLIGDLMKFGMENVAFQLAGLSAAQTSYQELPITEQPKSETTLPKPVYQPPYTDLTQSKQYSNKRNPFNIHLKISGYGLLTAWGITVLGAGAMNDATFGTTWIPIVGPFISIKIVEKSSEYSFQPGGKKLLKTAGNLQSTFAIYYLLSAIGYLSWNPPKSVSISPSNNLYGLCVSYSF